MKGHYIGTQHLVLSVASENEAITLQGGLSDGNKRYLVPVLNRVLDEMNVSGQHVKIERLKLDLGELPLNAFWDEGGRRLESVLRQELKKVLQGRRGGGESKISAKTETLQSLEAVGFYLLQGYLPNCMAGRPGLSFKSLFGEVAEHHPSRLQGLITDIGRNERVIRRLVIQLDELELSKLVAVLEPEHATVILGYLWDVRQAHRVRALLVIGERAFADLSWLVTLGYLIRNPGSQFNRKQYLKSLLGGMADRQGVGYADLLSLLELALERARGRHSLKSSMPAVIAELVREYRRKKDNNNGLEACPEAGPVSNVSSNQTRNRSDAAGALGRVREGDTPAFDQTALSEFDEKNGFREFFRELIQGRSKAFASLHEQATPDWVAFLSKTPPRQVLGALRRGLRRSGQTLEGVISKMSGLMSLQDWVSCLLPQHERQLAGLIRTLCSITATDTGELRVSLEAGRDGAQARVFWLAVITYLLEKGGADLDVKRLTGDLLGVKARELGCSSEKLMRMLSARGASVAADTRLPWARARRDREDSGYAIEVGGISRALSIKYYDRLALLRHFLHFGFLPWMSYRQNPGLSLKDLIMMVPELEVSVVSGLLNSDDKGDCASRIRRLLTVLPNYDAQDLVMRLLPGGEAGKDAFAESLRVYKDRAKDVVSFYSQVLSAVLRGEWVDLEMLIDQDFDAPVPHTLGERLNEENPDFHVLVSLLMEALEQGNSLSGILEALVVRYPRQTHSVFRLGLIREDEVERIAGQASAPVYLSLLECLQPVKLLKLENILTVLSEAPVRHRPGNDVDVRRALLISVLSWVRGDAGIKDFYRTLVGQLYGGEVSAQVLGGIRDSMQKAKGFEEERLHLAGALDDRLKSKETTKTSKRRTTERSETGGVVGFLDETCGDWREVLYRFLKSGEWGKEKEGREDATPMRQFLGSPAYALQALLDESSEKTKAVVHQSVAYAQTRNRWAQTLPEAVLARICFVVEPDLHRRLFEAGEVLARAWEDAVSRLNGSLVRRSVFWLFFLDFLNDCKQINRSTESLVSAFFEYFSGHYRKLGGSEANRSDLGRALLAGASGLARKSGHSALSAVLHHNRRMLLEFWGGEPVKREGRAVARHHLEQDPPSAKTASKKGDLAFTLERDEVDEDADPIYIENAGLVLTGAFLPHLFKGLGLLQVGDDGKSRMKDEASASRAVHMLQYLVDGRTDAPEPLLVLNKLLCGVPGGFPVEREVRLDEHEIEMCDKMHQSMLKNWSALSATSVQGLQETFLQREGRLNRVQDGWKLRVQRKTLDVLIDQVPWSISMVSNSWMPQPVFVTW